MTKKVQPNAKSKQWGATFRPNAGSAGRFMLRRKECPYCLLLYTSHASSTFFCYPFQPHHFRPFRSAFLSVFQHFVRHSSRNLPELPAFGWNVLPDCLLFDKTKNVKMQNVARPPCWLSRKKKNPSWMSVYCSWVCYCPWIIATGTRTVPAVCGHLFTKII